MCDVHIDGFTVDANGVKGEFFAVYEFFDADFGDMAEGREDAVEFFVVLNAVSIGATGTCDGFDDDGESDQMGGVDHIFFGACAKGVGDAQTSAFDAFFHQLFVAKSEDGVVGHPRDTELFAQSGGCEDKDLPLGFDAIDMTASEPLFDASDQVAFVHDAWDLEIIAEVGADFFGEGVCGCVANAEDTGADFGEAASILDHLGWISRAEEENLHNGLLRNAQAAFKRLDGRVLWGIFG